VTDDGRGLAEDRVPGLGLRGMSARADELGGRLAIRPSSPAGTAVRAWLPATDRD
jgi:signal transduction histidine kinase